MAVPAPPLSQYNDYGNYNANVSDGELNRQQDNQYQQYPEQSYPPPQPTANNNNNTTGTAPSIQQPQQEQQQFQYNVNQQQYAQTNTTGFDTSGGPDPASLAFSSASDSSLSKLSRSIGIRYQLLLDTVTPHWAARWTFSLVILLIFMARIVLAQGWYVICYGLSIYYLNLFIGFLSPKIDPAFQSGGEFDVDDMDNSDVGPMLPTKANEEFKPFIRRLPEFKFWLSATKATLISLFLTLFEVFDLPVFWPILLLYFILLFVSTMRQQIKHMIRYGYVPWDKGKKKYGKQTEDPSSLFSPTV